MRREGNRLILVALGILTVGSVAAMGAEICVNPAGSGGCKKTIGAAVAAAVSGDVIRIGPGTYTEGVVITKWIALEGQDQATTIIDATGKPNGVFIDGMASAPNPGVRNASVSHLTIKNADYEGILVANATGVNIVDNLVVDNNQKLDISAGSCPGLPPFETNEQDDCGEGIHLMGVDHSAVANNTVTDNSGGILVTDETGPNHDNLITGNDVEYNPYDCGITLASHPLAGAKGPAVSFGVFNNQVVANTVGHNGLKNGGGAGIGMYAAGPGNINYGNVATGNKLIENGLPGVAMHNHAVVPGLPPVVFHDNKVVDNYFDANAADQGPGIGTSGPTGINVASQVPVPGLVISGNVFHNEDIAISFNAPGDTGFDMLATVNSFEPKTIGLQQVGAGKILGRLNWWGCAGGPKTSGCASATAVIPIDPWLTAAPAF